VTVSFEAAALVLAWVVILVLAFAMAGMLTMIRRLEANQRQLAIAAGSSGSGTGHRAAAVARFAPERRPYALVLTTQRDCAACAELMPRFAEVVRRHGEKVDFRILAADRGPSLPAGLAVPVTTDPDAFAALSPGYTPGLVIVNRDGDVVEVGPGGDLDSVERWIDRQHLTPVTEEGL
jgi:hypothetical protein